MSVTFYFEGDDLVEVFHLGNGYEYPKHEINLSNSNAVFVTRSFGLVLDKELWGTVSVEEMPTYIHNLNVLKQDSIDRYSYDRFDQFLKLFQAAYANGKPVQYS